MGSCNSVLLLGRVPMISVAFSALNLMQMGQSLDSLVKYLIMPVVWLAFHGILEISCGHLSELFWPHIMSMLT